MIARLAAAMSIRLQQSLGTRNSPASRRALNGNINQFCTHHDIASRFQRYDYRGDGRPAREDNCCGSADDCGADKETDEDLRSGMIGGGDFFCGNVGRGLICHESECFMEKCLSQFGGLWPARAPHKRVPVRISLATLK